MLTRLWDCEIDLDNRVIEIGFLSPQENLSSEGINLSGYYGTQQNVQGLVSTVCGVPSLFIRETYYIM